MSTPIKEPEDKLQKIHFGVTEEFNEEQLKFVKKLVEVMGVNELSDRTTRLETTMDTVITRLDEVIKSNNSVVTALQGNQPQTTAISPTASQPMNQMDKIEAIGKLIQSLDPIIQRYFQPQQAAQSIVDPEIINEHLRASMMGNFEIGKAMTDSLKSKLTQKALGQVVSDVLKHEPA